MTLFDVEYEQGFYAFKELYTEFNKNLRSYFLSATMREESEFEKRFERHRLHINKFIQNVSGSELIRIDRRIMDSALNQLCEMESALNLLKKQHCLAA